MPRMIVMRRLARKQKLSDAWGVDIVTDNFQFYLFEEIIHTIGTIDSIDFIYAIAYSTYNLSYDIYM